MVNSKQRAAKNRRLIVNLFFLSILFMRVDTRATAAEVNTSQIQTERNIYRTKQISSRAGNDKSSHLNGGGPEGCDCPPELQGPRGFSGPRGSQGPRGFSGPRGSQGASGPRGPQGISGPTGASGPQGPRGATGPAGGLSQYGYIYNKSGRTVPLESDIIFDTNGILTAGITHTVGTSQIRVTSVGDYKITFSVSGVEPNQFALFVNGGLAVGTVYGSGAGTQQSYGQAIITLAAKDVLTLRNHTSAAAVTLQTLAGGTVGNVNASIIIEKLQ